eukprot:scaffold24028_cov152-Cylindrotheca_fusiformis.AAC.10
MAHARSHLPYKKCFFGRSLRFYHLHLEGSPSNTGAPHFCSFVPDSELSTARRPGRIWFQSQAMNEVLKGGNYLRFWELRTSTMTDLSNDAIDMERIERNRRNCYFRRMAAYSMIAVYIVVFYYLYYLKGDSGGKRI